MNFDVQTEKVDDSTYVIALGGEVDLYTAPEFKQQLLDVIAKGAKDVVVDFTRTTFIDSTTLGVLVGGVKRLRAQDKAEDFKLSTIENVVHDQIKYPTAGSAMPANLVKGQQADDVAAYVALCAASTDKQACPGIATTATGGQGLYASLGCQSCHSLDGSKSTGPTFKGLYGSKVQLTNGKTVTADEKYLLDSIIDPDLDIVKGYQPGVMTSVIKKGQVPKDQAQQLVDFIKQQK
jgi:anti-anti-sigma factor